MAVLGARGARTSPVLEKGLRQRSPTATLHREARSSQLSTDMTSCPPPRPPAPQSPLRRRGAKLAARTWKRLCPKRRPAGGRRETPPARPRPGVVRRRGRLPTPIPDPGPRPPAPTRASPCVCSAPQPQPQGPRERRRPARTRSDPNGRTHGRGAGCSSGRGGGAGATRSTAAAEPSARGTRRNRGSIAAADTCGCEGRAQALDPGPRAAGSSAPAGSTSAPAQCASEPPG